MHMIDALQDSTSGCIGGYRQLNLLKAPYFTPFWDLIWGIGPLRWYISG